MSTGKIVVGVLAGIATGAAIGILFAPDKGSKTRGKIARKSTDTVDDLKKSFASLIDEITDQFEGNKEEGKAAAAEVLKKAEKKVKESAKNDEA
ncbi:MAG: YtxH domain-containing protein [Bacteroidota bacterium]